MKYVDIKKYDIANGVGVRVSLFVSGCNHHCKGCFNAEAWDFNYGKDFNDETIDEIINALKPTYINGLSLLGGEPLDPKNQEGILKLLRKFNSEFPDKNVWCYSGYLYEYLLEQAKTNKTLKEILDYIDILVDGKFELDKKDITLLFRGSSNQRIINIKESLKNNKLILSDKNRRRNEDAIKC
ncbi:MAG: anaerobic ribonucleoside-triphosphate reductase activating protein [Firmicutes bacterium]|nr:anaerobic ribonucleoside-triphosphate reductase activating protein [Bacillota bacterium]